MKIIANIDTLITEAGKSSEAFQMRPHRVHIDNSAVPPVSASQGQDIRRGSCQTCQPPTKTSSSTQSSNHKAAAPQHQENSASLLGKQITKNLTMIT